VGDATRAAALVIQTSFLGDVVLTTPLLSYLAARGPVDVVTTPAGGALLEGHAAVRRVIRYDKRGTSSGIAGLRRLARDLREASYAAAYMAQGSSRSAALALLARIPLRVGFDTSAGRLLYTQRVPYRRDWHHATRLFQLAAQNASLPTPAPSLVPREQDVSAARTLLAQSPLAGRRFIVLAPGSVWATKRWPAFPEMVRALPQDFGIVVLGGSDDTPLAAECVAVAPDRVLDATGRLSLLGSAAMIRDAAAVVTNDSLPQHLASAMATPTITIYGPTLPSFGFGPLASRATVVEHLGPLDCRPCSAHGPQRCPRGHFRCMREISAATVTAATLTLLGD
jgi:heptosyltransferase II